MLKSTKWRLFTIACIFWCLHLLYVVIFYKNLPEMVITHMKLNGEPDGFGDRWMVFLDLLVNFGLLLLLACVIQHPHWANYPNTITPENKDFMYRRMQLSLGGFSIVLSIVFFCINLNSFGIKTFNVPMLILAYTSLFVGLIYLSKTK